MVNIKSSLLRKENVLRLAIHTELSNKIDVWRENEAGQMLLRYY